MSNYGLFTVDDDAFRRAAKSLDAEWRRSAAQYVSSAIRRSATIVQQNMKAEARPHRKTGRMESGIQQHKSGQGMSIVVKVGVGGSIAPLIVGGVRPHDYTGVRMPILTSAGVVTWSEKVKHPGFAPDRFPARAIHKSRPAIRAILDTTTARMAASLAKHMEGH